MFRKNCFSSFGTLPLRTIIFILSMIAFCILFILFFQGINSVSDTSLTKQRESLETALNRSVLQCYAVEGFYPPNLEYLKKHYGLLYDQDLFFVDYQPVGSNILPEITIIMQEGSSK